MKLPDWTLSLRNKIKVVIIELPRFKNKDKLFKMRIHQKYVEIIFGYSFESTKKNFTSISNIPAVSFPPSFNAKNTKSDLDPQWKKKQNTKLIDRFFYSKLNSWTWKKPLRFGENYSNFHGLVEKPRKKKFSKWFRSKNPLTRC